MRPLGGPAYPGGEADDAPEPTTGWGGRIALAAVMVAVVLIVVLIVVVHLTGTVGPAAH